MVDIYGQRDITLYLIRLAYFYLEIKKQRKIFIDR